MGFFDRLAGKKTSSSNPAPSPAGAPQAGDPGVATGNILPRLAAARACLDTKDLPGALAIYEEVLAAAGDRADVLVSISGDLGSTGHIASIIELIAPRYDAEKHGPATGLNILQAYLAVRHTDAARHVLDILFELNRPELEDRLHGFSNALAEMIASGASPIPLHGAGDASDPAAAPPAVAKVDLVSISKPIWFYGLEPLAEKILPPKAPRIRRIAFAQLALPGAYPDVLAAQARPEDELGRLSRALPLWFAETFYFSPHYAPIAAVGILHPPGDGPKRPFIFGAEWTTENLRQLCDSSSGEGLDYIFTGALRQLSGDHELILRVWEVKKFRERKQFLVRWNPSTADAELGKLHEQIRLFMEWTPEKSGLPYAAPASPRVWLDTLGASLGLFLAEKTLLPKEILPSLAPTFNELAPHAMSTASASLAWLTTLHRARALGLAPSLAEVVLSPNPVVAEARSTLAL
ncbi:MAG: hypothetical protein H7343_13860 [Undibacterium sp.]|nr:hypothetical protein [Opitutaceae bacterium]